MNPKKIKGVEATRKYASTRALVAVVIPGKLHLQETQDPLAVGQWWVLIIHRVRQQNGVNIILLGSSK